MTQLDAAKFIALALDLNADISNNDRFTRLLNTVRQFIPCDASALLVFQDGQFKPVAIDGLEKDVINQSFPISEHPRLEIIARAGDVVRFPTDSQLPDPYDGLIPNQGEQLKVHSCIGLPLIAKDCLIGALTIDSFDEAKFDDFANEDLRAISTLAATSLNSALIVEHAEKQTVITATNEVGMSIPTTMIGKSDGMLALKHEIEVVAGSGLNVLILGETGVGKELVAQDIHRLSPRADQKLTYLNCAALPESIAESELFGHVKGAFTGATNHRKGKFETANKSTLFLDEIGELPLTIQAKLLRVLQYGELQRIGDDHIHHVDVRIIAATNRNLAKAVVDGHFRSDLFHRLSVFPIQVPPLRDREIDIPLLTEFFIQKCRLKLDLVELEIDRRSQKQLREYAWPGNVRELEHCIYRAAILAKAETNSDHVAINSYHLNIDIKNTINIKRKPTKVHKYHGNLKQATESFQRTCINEALADNKGNWADTARSLALDSGNLHRLAKRLGLK